MEPSCVDGFYRTLAETKGQYDLYRFNTKTINEKGEVLSQSPVHPKEETAWEFCYDLLSGTRKSTLVEYVFSRQVYLNNRGFVSFPAAWGSDWCTWIRYGSESGIRLISGPLVAHRSSRKNISNSLEYTTQKIHALFQYSEWIQNIYSQQRTYHTFISEKKMNAALETHFFRSLFNHPPLPVIRQSGKAAKVAERLFAEKKTQYFFRIFLKSVKTIIHQLWKRLSQNNQFT